MSNAEELIESLTIEKEYAEIQLEEARHEISDLQRQLQEYRNNDNEKGSLLEYRQAVKSLKEIVDGQFRKLSDNQKNIDVLIEESQRLKGQVSELQNLNEKMEVELKELRFATDTHQQQDLIERLSEKILILESEIIDKQALIREYEERETVYEEIQTEYEQLLKSHHRDLLEKESRIAKLTAALNANRRQGPMDKENASDQPYIYLK